MKLSVIIPIYNEAGTLADLLDRVKGVECDKEILIVDDGSNAATKSELERVVNGDATVITHDHNMGKGTAIRTALKYATGQAVIIQDADLEYYPEDFLKLMELYEQNGAQAVYGVRDLSDRSPLMRFGNNLMTLVTNILYGQKLRDMETCYKMIDRELFQSLQLNSRRFEIEAEITAKLIRSGVKILQTPIRYKHRYEGKKLTPLDGIPTIGALLAYRFWKPASN